MKEYTITMNFTIESNKDYEEISDFAEQLAEDMMNDENFIYHNNIEITQISIHDIQSNYEEEDNIYLNSDDE